MSTTNNQPGLTYGVNIDEANAAKATMAASLNTENPNVLNKAGAFATLFDIHNLGYQHPVLVLKTEEPGSKQMLAIKNGYIESICADMLNHLINDCIVMGARPLSVQDAVVCGKLEKEVITRMVAAMAKLCAENGCTLTGGETSEQPGIVEDGTYILTSSIVGIVEKDEIIDGSNIAPGHSVLGLAANGLHTNGYTLARQLMATYPEAAEEKVPSIEPDQEPQTFLETILTPHRCYYNALKGLFGKDTPLKGLAHITGGGIVENLNRILPSNCNADINLSAYEVLPIFKYIAQKGNVAPAEMLRTFNMGVGLAAVVPQESVSAVCQHIEAAGVRCYPIGKITAGAGKVVTAGALNL